MRISYASLSLLTFHHVGKIQARFCPENVDDVARYCLETVVNSTITNSFTVVKPRSTLAISVVTEMKLIQGKCVLTVKYTVNYLKHPDSPHILSGLRSVDIKLQLCTLDFRREEFAVPLPRED